MLTFLLVLGMGVTIAMVADLALTYAGGEHRAALHQLRTTSTIAGDGELICLTGRISEIPAPLHAPLRGLPCAAYCTRATLHYGGRSAQQTSTPASVDRGAVTVVEQRMTMFYLTTSEGPVRVCGEAVELALPARRVFGPRADRQQAFLHPWRISAERAPRVRGLREISVGLGQEVSVRGVLTEEPSDVAHGTYREAPQRHYLAGTVRTPILIGPPPARALAPGRHSQGAP